MTKVFLYHAFLFSNHILLRKVYTINNNKQAFSFQLARLTHLKHHLILKASITMISSSFESLHKKLFVFPPSCQVFGQCHNTSSWGRDIPPPRPPFELALFSQIIQCKSMLIVSFVNMVELSLHFGCSQLFGYLILHLIAKKSKSPQKNDDRPYSQSKSPISGIQASEIYVFVFEKFYDSE